jgi:Ser/Thr protein kinase RdoA (MazF antagonist)
MDPKIHELYTENILADVCLRFGIDPNTLEKLDGFESYIYSFEKEGKGYILRVGHSSHRDPDAVQGEAEFIDYLGANGINVGRPVRDAEGNLVEAIPAAEGIFSAVVFEKVPGDHAPWEMWQDGELMNKLGRLLGKMHALTKNFEPSEQKYRRLTWEDDNIVSLESIKNGLPPDEAEVIGKQYQELVRQVSALPKDRDNYGLVHFDVHGGNFFVHEGQIYLFDFDDSLYTWFANDIAMVLYYGANGFRNDPEALEKQIRRFFVGYGEENEINPVWLEYIQAFMLIRDLILYAVIHHDIPKEEWDEWCQRLIAGVKQRWGTFEPFLPIDFTTVLD